MGPDHFTAPMARIDFRVGGVSLLCMRAPAEFGGQDFYSTWEYTEIVPMERIAFIHNLANEHGEKNRAHVDRDAAGLSRRSAPGDNIQGAGR